MKISSAASLLLALMFGQCQPPRDTKTVGSVEKFDQALDGIIATDAKIEVVGQGFEWSEGPVWIAQENKLLFSDVPKNTIYQWTASGGVEVYLTPSGYTGTTPSASNEPGSNGLTLDPNGNLVLCQHGDRRVARMNSSIDQPKPIFVTLADQFGGKRLNSPNDVVFASDGSFYFTDPPYGLPKQAEDSTKEIPFQGVYHVTTSGEVKLITDSLTRPNGIALSPDGKQLIVANSDPERARWYVYDLIQPDSAASGRILYDATKDAQELKGLPDGLRVDSKGNIFATGPGGVYIFTNEGKLAGRIRLPEATANCAFADDEKTLFTTSDMLLIRISLKQ